MPELLDNLDRQPSSISTALISQVRRSLSKLDSHERLEILAKVVDELLHDTESLADALYGQKRK